MTRQKIRPMAEGGILVAIAVLFSFISLYIPLIGAFVMMIQPLPIILLGVRHSIRWSILATIATGILLALLIHPIQAVTEMTLCVAGIIMGEAFRRQYSYQTILLWGGCGFMLAIAGIMGLTFLMMGINPIANTSEMFRKSMEQAISIYQQAGMSEAMIQEMQRMMGPINELLSVAIPAIFFIGAFFYAGANLLIARVVLRRLGHLLPDIPPLKHWWLSRWLVHLYLVSLLMNYWGGSRQISWLQDAGVNILMVTSLMLLVQGVAVLFYAADKYNLSRMVRGFILVLILTSNLLSQIVVMVGLVDLVIDYRRLRRTDQE